MIKELFISIAFCLCLNSPSPAKAGELMPHVGQNILALVRIDRGPRRGIVVPGKPIRWFYEVLMPDGGVQLFEATGPIKGVRNMAPFSDNHPNLAIFSGIFKSASSTVVSGAVGGLMVP